MQTVGYTKPYCVLFFMVVSLMNTAICAEFKLISGRSSEQVFSDPRVAALAKAAAKGDMETIDRLVQQGANIHGKGDQGINPLNWAMIAKNKTGVKKLLEKGADPNQLILGNRYTAVGVAVRSNFNVMTEILELLLQHGGDPNNGGYNSALYIAVNERSLKKIKLLLKYGADINYQDGNGNTAAMAAEPIGSYDLMYYLLDSGADHTLVKRPGWTLASIVQSRNPALLTKEAQGWRVKVIELLEERGVQFPVAYPTKQFCLKIDTSCKVGEPLATKAYFKYGPFEGR